ncbi:MAG: VWA domain-containing protein [Solirubrobacteraceae bacterium]|nr:VWA domain-containing protein [Solirubrobacteraceae bacterium]
MSFAAPLLLLGLLLVPVAVVAYVVHDRRREARSPLARPALLPSVMPSVVGSRRHVAPALLLVAATLLLVGLARPQRTVAVPVERATVMLVTDRSGSMRAKDLQPDRIAAVKSAARRFLDAAPRDLRVGAIAFNHNVRLLAGPTTDHDRVADRIDRITARGSTAAGDALATALRSVRPRGDTDDGPPAAIVLLSDGESVRGQDPVKVAERAKDAGVLIHTVALGTDEGTLESRRADGSTRVQQVPPDRETLQRIAEISGGTYSDAESNDALNAVYDRLGSEVTTVPGERELTAVALGGALVLILLGAGSSLALVGRPI